MKTLTIKCNKPVVAIPFEDYESMKETIELLSANPRLADELAKDRARIEKGQFIELSDLKKKFGIKKNIGIDTISE